MAYPTTLKGGRVRVLLGDDSSPMQYTAPCGVTSKSVTLTKGLEEVNLGDCDNADKIGWVGRDATSFSMEVSGEGVLAAESVKAWLDAQESADSTPVKVEIELPTEIITWTGLMQIESFTFAVESNTQRATASVSMQSDGEMVRTTETV